MCAAPRKHDGKRCEIKGGAKKVAVMVY